MAKKPRLGLYLVDEAMKRQIKVASAKRGLAVSEYCVRAIEEQLVRDGERSPGPQEIEQESTLLARMRQLRKEISPIDMPTWKLVEQGRREV